MMIPHVLDMLVGTEVDGAFGPIRATQGLTDLQIQFEGIVTNDVLKVWGTNRKVPGPDFEGWFQIGTDVSTNGNVRFEDSPRWMKVERDSDAGAGTVLASLIGTEYP